MTTNKMMPITQRKKRLPIRRIILFAFSAWALYTYIFVQRPAMEMQAEHAMRLHHEILEYNQELTNINVQIQALHSDSYIASIAESRYHLSFPNSLVFVSKK